MKDDQLDASDLLLPVTGNNEFNIITALYAESLGAKRKFSIEKANNKYIPLAERI